MGGFAHGESSLMALAALAAAGLLIARLARLVRVPDVALFLVAGIGLQLVGWVPFRQDSELGRSVTVLAAAYILYLGGETLELTVVRGLWRTILLLATVGVAVTAVVTGAAAAILLGLTLTSGLLLGSVVAATDPAVLIPVYRSLRVPKRISEVVISEAALNDATGAVATTLVLGVIISGQWSAVGAVDVFVRLAGVGIVAGAILGVVFVIAVSSGRIVPRDLAGVFTLPTALLAYLLSETAGGSGLMAAFTAGVVVRNHGWLPLTVSESTRELTREYMEPTSVFLRAILFLGLGANVDLRPLSGPLLIPSLEVVAVLIVVARPLTVLVCALPDRSARWTARELTVFAWTRETGVVPGALAALVVAKKVPGAAEVAAVTVLAILVTLVIQAPTTGLLLKRLGLSPGEPLPASSPGGVP